MFAELGRSKLLVAFFCVPVILVAQTGTWETVDISCGVLLRDLCMLADGQYGWAVGSTGAGGQQFTCVLRTTDWGTNWIELPFSDSIAVSLAGVCFVSADSGWVVGSYGRIYATTDGGMSWTQQSSGITRGLSKVHFLDPNHGWATGGWSDGNSYPVLRTTDGGMTWQNLSFGSNCYSCDDIFFSDTLNGWICGYDAMLNAHIHHTSDGGQTWIRQTVPLGSAVVSAIDFPTATHGWATTSSLYQTPAGAILHTTDGGDTWVVQAYTNLHYNYCLDCQDTLNIAIAAVQILSPTQEKVFRTSDGGQTWNQHTPPIVSYTYGIQYCGSSIWLAADNGQIVRSVDNGQTWAWEYYAPLWNSMAWSDSVGGWLVVGSFTGGQGYCRRTTDGGTTWFHDASAPGGAQVFFVDPDYGWMLKEGNSASVWRTTDAGATWSQYSIGTGNWVGGIFFVSQDSGWAFGSNGTIRFSSNGGVSWNPQSSGTTYYVDVLFFVNPNEGWAAGGYGGANGFILHTTNGGANWNPQTPALYDHFDCGCFLDNQNLWLGAIAGRVQKTTNGGVSWQYLSQVNHFYAPDISMKDAQEGWFAVGNAASSAPGEDGRGFIYHTTDGGTTWCQEYQGVRVRSFINDMALQPGGIRWACGAHGTILRYNPLGVVTNGEGFIAIGLRVQPSPFKFTTSISYTLHESSKIVLEIHDALGRFVSRLVDGVQSGGGHIVCWDGRDISGQRMPEGVYFVQLRNHDVILGVSKLLLVN